MGADGSITEITLERFLADSPNNTEEMFRELKALSDKLFQAVDNAEGSRAKRELPLYDWAIDCATESPETLLVDTPDEESIQIYLKRRQQMLNLVPEVLDRLTEVQRRRFLLHKVKRLTTRKIAALEGVSQPSIVESIAGAEKKIEKYLLKLEQIAQKHLSRRRISEKCNSAYLNRTLINTGAPSAGHIRTLGTSFAVLSATTIRKGCERPRVIAPPSAQAQ